MAAIPTSLTTVTTRGSEAGETVARAKRTDRAEARRRYRASQELTEGELDATEGEGTAAAATSRTARAARPSAAGSTPTPPRIGIGQAFRLSFRPLDLRGDVAAFPRIATRTKALWVPVALTLAATVLVAVVGTNGTDLVSVLTNFVYQYFVFTPAIGGVFIAGFLAPRASWTRCIQSARPRAAKSEWMRSDDGSVESA